MEPRYFIGLDVHKSSTSYAVRDRLGNIVVEGKTATLYSDLYDRLAPYLAQGRVALEASTSYFALYQAFIREGHTADVANVIQMRQLLAKSDKLDARRLADMMRLGTLPCSFIPPDDIQHLRNIVRTRHALVEEKTSWKNRIVALLDRNGVVMPPSTPFTKGWQAHLQRYLGHGGASLELRVSFEHYMDLERKVEQLDQEMIGYTMEHWKEEYELIQTVPGFGPILACYIVSEVMPIERFASEKKLRRYAGVCPVSKSSGESASAGRIPKSSSRSILRWALVEAAHSASQTGTRLAEYYKRKKKQKGCAALAAVALASSLSDILFHVLTRRTPYSRGEGRAKEETKQT